MLTVRNALHLPVFSQARLVAGKAGLDNVIRWIHIVSMPESGEYEWTKGGELILTTGFGLRANEEKQATLIPSLVEYGISGLVLSVGHYFEETPAIMREEADRLDFPIVELPGDVPFVEVTEAIFVHIVNEQYATLQRAQEIHKTLMRVVLNSGTLQELARALAELLNRSITIESPTFQVLASVQQGQIDTARQRTIESGRTTPDVIQYLQRHHIREQLLDDHTPVVIPRQPDVGMDIERIVAPVIVAKTLLGYMWIIADEGEFTDLDKVAVEQAATVAALLLYKEQAVQESLRTMRGDFFSQILQVDQYSLAELESRAAIFEFRLNRHYQVLVVEGSHSPNEIANQIEASLRDDVVSLVVQREQRTVVVLQTHQSPDGKRIGQQLANALAALSPPIIGVGNPTDELRGIAGSYEQALEALAVARLMRQNEGVFMFGELGLLHWLMQLPDEALRDNIYYSAVCGLDEKDRDLFETLDAFLEHGGSMKDAADSLFVHRNTLTYRLGRIEDLTNLDLRQTTNQINLYVALKTYRLRHKSRQ